MPKTLPHSFGFRPAVDLDKLNQLADELEVEATADSLARTMNVPAAASLPDRREQRLESNRRSRPGRGT